jgi:solute carrier family 31 (copper transporter), member 1
MSGMTMSASPTTMANMSMTMAMLMPTSTDGTSNSSSSDMMPMSMMAMVFFQAVNTPLFSTQWTPTDQGPYAGTCVFLVTLGAVYRILCAVERVIFAMPTAAGYAQSGEEGAKLGHPLAPRRLRSGWTAQPFHIATETSRALFEVIVHGIGYLL